MKKGLLFFIFLGYYLSIVAQCIINPFTGEGIYPSGDSLPCAIANSINIPVYTWQFRSPTYINTMVFDSLRVDSISVGGNWTYPIMLTSFNNRNNTFIADTFGCLTLRSKQPSAPSKDTVHFYIKLWLDGNPAPLVGEMEQILRQVSPNLPNMPGFTFPIMVNAIAQGDNCPSGVSAFGNSNIAEGAVFFDNNNDGIINGNDFPMVNVKVSQGPYNRSLYTNSLGKYSLKVNSGNYYFAAQPEPEFIVSTLPTTHTVYFPSSGDTIANLNFGLFPIDTFRDLKITANVNAFRPGFPSTHSIFYENRGTLIVDSGTISYTLDTNLLYSYATPFPDSVNNDTYFWNFTDLKPTEQRKIEIHTALPPDTSLLQRSIINEAYIYSNYLEPDSSNNMFLTETTVTGSFDPNDKTPYPTEKLDEAFVNSGKPLLYRIRFQNTGTDTAFNITVLDTLDLDKFDPTTLSIIGSSHEYTFRIEQGNIAIWEFANILLPDSNVNEQGSHGFVMFELNLLPGLGHGDQILNRAGIYFDFNPVVLTDYATSRVDFSSGISEVAFNNSAVSLYPNPSQNHLIISHQQWQQGTSIVLYDLSGKAMLNQPLDGKTTEVSTANLPNGIYLYQVLGATGIEGLGKVVIAK